MELGPTGVWSADLRFGDPAATREAAAELEDLGYSALWFPAGFDEQVFTACSALLEATTRVVVATGIVSVWSPAAAVTAAAAATLRAAHPDRFLLGLGVSHAPFVDADAPGRYRQPLAAMAAYLDELDRADPPIPASERVLAALGPRMLALARDRAGGAHPYLVTPEHTRRARDVLGPGRWLAPEQGVVLERDPSTAREIARAHLAIYLTLPNYVTNLARLGFGAEDVANGGSDRLVDALVAWGGEDAIARRVGEHRAAGADHVCVQVLAPPGAPGPPRPQWRALAPVLLS